MMPRPIAISNLRGKMKVPTSIPGPTPITKQPDTPRVVIITPVQTQGPVEKVYTTQPVFKAGPKKFTVTVRQPRLRHLIGQRMVGLADRSDHEKRPGTVIAPDGTMTEDKNGVVKSSDDHSNE